MNRASRVEGSALQISTVRWPGSSKQPSWAPLLIYIAIFSRNASG
jgi:hypothetical protein